MMKTCIVCGLQYQTMAERGYHYCHKCALMTIGKILTLMLPILFEFTGKQLLALDKQCKDIRSYVANELDRRTRYYANMLEQRKP